MDRKANFRDEGGMIARVTNISDRRRRPALPELSDEALAVLVRDLALKEEKALQELCVAVLNDPNACLESKRLARELRQDA